MQTTRLNQNLDQFIAASLAAPQNLAPCCSKGCNACCSEPAYCDVNEVAAMLELITPVEREA